MTYTAFDPGELTAEASLNHVILGSMAEPEARDRLAQDACSRNALHALATDHGLTSVRHSHLADDLADASASGDATTAHRAVVTLRTFGTRLGALIATLRDPATAVGQGKSAVRRGFLEHWLTIDSIWLAGGLLAGRCGPHILSGVNSVANDIAHPCPVGVLQQPELAPLIGAARSGKPAAASEAVVVADLGHTSIKAAVAQWHAGTLASLGPFSTHPTPASASADELENAFAVALIPAVKAAAAARGDQMRVIVSVASFVQDGLPVDDGQGIYGCLARRTGVLLRRLEAATGVRADLRYLHDGTAAASASAATNSATVTVGTWLGVGFLPAESSHIPYMGQPSPARPPGIHASSTGSSGGTQ